MRFFLKMATSQSTFFGDHRRLVVAETNFKFMTSGTNILHIAFLSRNQVDDIFRFTTKNLRNRIRPASAGARKAIS